MLLLSANAGAVRVQVRAATRLEGRTDRNAAAQSGVVVRGTLRDDVGHPVPDSHVSIAFYLGAGDGPAARLSDSPRRCADASASRDAHIAPDEYVVDTDATGSFCVQTTLPFDRGTMKLRFAGSSLHDATAAEVPFDLARPAVTLAFDPEPSIASLDRPFYSVGLRVTSPSISKDGWRVVLKDEKGRAIGSANVDPDGLVRIDVATHELGDPGPGELSAELEGTPLISRPVSHAIERHVKVDLTLAAPEPRGVPEDGIPVEVRARSSRGPVGSGSVEATIGDRAVGAAAVRAGHADLVATFASARDRTAPVSIRYLSDAPWWEPGAPLAFGIGVEAPSVWRRAPPILLALAVAAWMMRGSWLSRLSWPSREKRRAPRPADERVMQVLREKRPDEGWSGRVIDAHDGYPIEGAIVSIVVPSFPGSDDGAARAGAEAVTNPEGQFALGPFAGKAVLRVRAAWHATIEQPLPAPSEVSIPMVARRRRLLDRLVAWAAREWGPWSGAREPTPEQVASRARQAKDKLGPERAAEVEAWARAVEWTAFGKDRVDERAELSVSSREPTKRPPNL